RILLNTNGRRLAAEPAFARQLTEFRDVLDVYLQYDGPSAEATVRLRGADVRAEKERALAVLGELGLKTILVMTVCPENLADVPAVLRKAAETDVVSGVTYQAMAFCGRAGQVETASVETTASKTTAAAEHRDDGADRVTMPDICDALATLPWLDRGDIFPLPCSHPYCTQISYLHCRPGRRPFPLVRLAPGATSAPALQSRLSYDASMYGELLPLVRRGLCPMRLRWRDLPAALAAYRFFRRAETTRWRGEKLLRIVVKQFMDRETFDVSRATRCCVGVLTGDGRIVPFCAYNCVHR
ncbi:MAG: hypothetical protein U1E05_25285, partial [Patescibacteria group bacterium]|nr:hypothetical protein [Patescibacteria group bacterium]